MMSHIIYFLKVIINWDSWRELFWIEIIMNNITLQVKSKTKIIVDCEQYNLDCTWTWNVAKFFVSVLLHSILYIAMHMIFIQR